MTLHYMSAAHNVGERSEVEAEEVRSEREAKRREAIDN